MAVNFRLKLLAFKSGLLVLAVAVFLAGLGTRLSVYQGKANDATMVRVRLGVEKQPDLAPAQCIHLQPAQEDLGFAGASDCWRQAMPDIASAHEAVERVEQPVPAHTVYDLDLPQLAYRPPPIHS